MNNLDIFHMAVKNLWRRKTRTFLTVLGVVIGTSSIIVMLSLGIAMDQSFKEQLSQMGSLNIIEVNNYGYYVESGSGGSNGKQVKLDDDAVSKFKKIPGVEAVMAAKSAYLKVASGKMVAGVPVYGIDPSVMEAFDFKVEEGRLLLPTDKDTLVFGKQTTRRFRNPRLRNENFNPWDGNAPQVELISSKLLLTTDMEYGERQDSRVQQDSNYKPPKPHNVKGVGILAESNSEKDYGVYMNITALERLLEEDRRVNPQRTSRGEDRDADKYERIDVKVRDIQQVEAIQEKIKTMGFQAYSLTDMLKSMKETSKKLQMLLGGIGAVSLFVAAIGITNTMIMSIYERTREIGVMKVLGANLRDIRKLFLLEAAMIGFFGGVLGMVLSYGISLILNKVGAGFLGRGMGGSNSVSVIPWTLAAAAVVFAMLVGILSGYSPARRAMKLSAIDAIKTE
ncbi:ABC transporter permease [Geosporobacter ferrireducens]|uniref:ABC transporter n=1 Tax=Geosporobacter ferrireducens TaxID=1424294 RepID=A0A1D8GQK7_9FIRM|nr:ABC transporter permease [Geosporobacter ferrireducens]AOT73084.1 ABC transporter [Geosporobacter ferrireducens]MTI53257.1 ABC transporter permease [Geosporobacter ferrireducens]